MRFWRRYLTILAAILLLSLTAGCGARSPAPGQRPAGTPAGKETLKGKVIVFYAGSLAVSLERMAKEFARLHPGVSVELEGSAVPARQPRRLQTSINPATL
ncbi:hypothetical protein [Thermodesulfitimonas autotrophica]|uniref:hypothetical protein n=1 Tax=Thermodesulfitimonas autotrophica TaxID=1894989 RepID=UPI002FE098EC